MSDRDQVRLDWLERAHTLHRKAVILYVVDGYEVTIAWDDSEISPGFHGETLAMAQRIERAARLKCPFKDFNGGDIYEGDTIQHPDGLSAKVVYDPGHGMWRADYGDGSPPSTLSLQIGDKGRAVVV